MLVLWYIGGVLLARFMPKGAAGDSRHTHILGAYVLGMVSPLYQGLRALVQMYDAAALPAFALQVSSLLVRQKPIGLGQWSGGVFPYENTLIALLNGGTRLAVVAIALLTVTSGLRAAYQASTPRVWAAAVAALAGGLLVAHMLARLLVTVLAPTGLL